MANHSGSTETSKRCLDETCSTIKSATEFDTFKLNNSANASAQQARSEARNNSNESGANSKTIKQAAYCGTLDSSIKQASLAASPTFEEIPLDLPLALPTDLALANDSNQLESNQLDSNRRSEPNLIGSARLAHSSINHTTDHSNDHSTDRSSLDHSSSDHCSLVASIGGASFPDNSLQQQFAILKQQKLNAGKPKSSDPLHINNLVQTGLNSPLVKSYVANHCGSTYCNCEYRLTGDAHQLLDDHQQFNHLNNNNNNFGDQYSSSRCNYGAHFDSQTDLCGHSSIDDLRLPVNKLADTAYDRPFDSDLCKSLKGDLYDHNPGSFAYPKDPSYHRGASCDANFSKINEPNLSCKDCLFESENCLCNNLVTTQPSLNGSLVNANLIGASNLIGTSNLSGSNFVQSNPFSSTNLVNRTKVNPRITRYLEPLLSEQNLKKSKPNLHYSSSIGSRSSPSLPTQRSPKCACVDCFDLFKFTSRVKLTNSVSDSLSTKQNLTSSASFSSSSSPNLSFKSVSSGRYLATCLLASKATIVLRLVRRLYFYLCLLLSLLVSLLPLRNGKDNQHKLCEHRNKIMRLKERVVILMIVACCVLCTFFVLQLKISEDMDSSTKFRLVFRNLPFKSKV